MAGLPRILELASASASSVDLDQHQHLLRQLLCRHSSASLCDCDDYHRQRAKVLGKTKKEAKLNKLMSIVMVMMKKRKLIKLLMVITISSNWLVSVLECTCLFWSAHVCFGVHMSGL